MFSANASRFLVLAVALISFSCSEKQFAPVAIELAPVNQKSRPIRFHQTAEVLCVPPYGSVDIPDSGGFVRVNTSKRDRRIRIRGRMNHLRPNTQYTVFIMNLTRPGASSWESRSFCNYGPWRNVVSLVTDSDGDARFDFSSARSKYMRKGSYNLSVWVNETSKSSTALISDSFRVNVR